MTVNPRVCFVVDCVLIQPQTGPGGQTVPANRKWSRGCCVVVGSCGGQNKVGGRSFSAITAELMIPKYEPALQHSPKADNISISAEMSISVILSGDADRINPAVLRTDSAQPQVVTRWNHPAGRLEWIRRRGHNLTGSRATNGPWPETLGRNGQTGHGTPSVRQRPVGSRNSPQKSQMTST